MNKQNLILFVAGDEPNSRLAKENFRVLLRDHLGSDYDADIIDVFENFTAALDHNILLTPALVRTGPAPPVTVYGNLSDHSGVLSALGATRREMT